MIELFLRALSASAVQSPSPAPKAGLASTIACWLPKKPLRCCSFAGLALPQLSQIAVHTEARAESATLFLSRNPDVDSEGCRRLVLQRWYLECSPTFTDNKECALYLRRKHLATRSFAAFFSDRSLSRNQQSMTPIQPSELNASGLLPVSRHDQHFVLPLPAPVFWKNYLIRIAFGATQQSTLRGMNVFSTDS